MKTTRFTLILTMTTLLSIFPLELIAGLNPPKKQQPLSLKQLSQKKPRFYWRKMSRAFGHYTRVLKAPVVKVKGYLGSADLNRQWVRIYSDYSAEKGSYGDWIDVVLPRGHYKFLHKKIQNKGYQVTVYGSVKIIPIKKYFQIRATRIGAEIKLGRLMKSLKMPKGLVINR